MTGAAARDAIRELYRRLDAPTWAAANLDGLADVLRDLSWLPAGPVEIVVPSLIALPEHDRAALLAVLRRAVRESVDSPHPLRAEPGPYRA